MKTEIEKLAKAFAGQVVKIVHKSIADSIGGSSEDEGDDNLKSKTDAKPAKAKRKYTRKAKTAANAETPAASASAAEVAG